MDITYVPMARGFVYLCAVVDWFSRKVLSWRLSITMDAAFCIEAVDEALARHGKPDEFWWKSRRASGPAPDHSAPFCARCGDKGAHDGAIEHLNQMRRGRQCREMFEK